MKVKLTSFALWIKDLLKEHRPKMYRPLEEAGPLDGVVQQASGRSGRVLWQ
jgi:hypothetical protein